MSARTPWQTGEQSIASIAGDTSGLWPAVFDDEGNLVALVNFTDQTNLIAAAPELLAALKSIGCRRARIYASGNTCDEMLAHDPDYGRCAACAAIAKAEGRS